ncbi:hypothetical protein ACWD25_26780 [Streptomyces sp. NPDC002920]
MRRTTGGAVRTSGRCDAGRALGARRVGLYVAVEDFEGVTLPRPGSTPWRTASPSTSSGCAPSPAACT